MVPSRCSGFDTRKHMLHHLAPYFRELEPLQKYLFVLRTTTVACLLMAEVGTEVDDESSRQSDLLAIKLLKGRHWTSTLHVGLPPRYTLASNPRRGGKTTTKLRKAKHTHPVFRIVHPMVRLTKKVLQG